MRDVSGLDIIRNELKTFGATERAGKMREDRLKRFVCAERRNDDGHGKNRNKNRGKSRKAKQEVDGGHIRDYMKYCRVVEDKVNNGED